MRFPSHGCDEDNPQSLLQVLQKSQPETTPDAISEPRSTLRTKLYNQVEVA